MTSLEGLVKPSINCIAVLITLPTLTTSDRFLYFFVFFRFIPDPNLKDEALLKHLGVATPADAAKKIFKGEINKISTEIAKLSGFNDEETTDKEVKN